MPGLARYCAKRWRHGRRWRHAPDLSDVLPIGGWIEHDLPLPGKHYSFAVVELAQMEADLAALNERKCRTLRVHLAKESAGIESLLVSRADAMKG